MSGRLRGIVGMGLAVLLLGGCEESVDPIIGTDRAFTIYGFFDARADTQAVRIFLIDDLLAPERPDPLAAEVRADELQTGRSFAWRDSTVRFPSGQFGHIFFAEFRAGFEQTYRLTVRRADGAEARAEVTVPPEALPEVLPPEVSGLDILVPVFWRRAPRLNDIRVAYDVALIQLFPASEDTALIGQSRLEVDYGEAQEPAADGILTRVALREDRRQIFRRLQLTGEQRLVLCGFEQRVLVSNAEWAPPGGAYDPEVLVEPGTFSNVEGGFGFVGAGYADSVAFRIEPAIAEAAGYVVDETFCE